MTTKKSSSKRPGVKDRARAIVADARRYDSDTRKSIKHMLDSDAGDLAVFVARAEAGDMICDTTRIDKEQMTVAELLENVRGVPLWVQHWLERYAGGDEHALEIHGLHDDDATREIARLVYDVLYTDSNMRFADTDNLGGHGFPAEARDFIEEWMFRITKDDELVQPWGNPDMAVVALPILLDMSAGPLIEFERDPTLAMLRGAMKALTTKRERREFLRGADEADAAPEKESTANWSAAFKLSRVLADPRTPPETRAALETALNEFAMAARVNVYHPALARRAFQLMCESKPKGNARECKRDRRELLALLDSIDEGEGGES
jgi:hypothetical protein